MATKVEEKPASVPATDVFEPGTLSVDSHHVHTGTGTSNPPKPLFIVSPTVQGKYPVLLFLHGYACNNDFYSQLFQHISSHGFIIVAPQLYPWYELLIPYRLEKAYADEVAKWLFTGLQSVLPEHVHANLNKLVVGGHSRGGCAAFALALGRSVQVSALALVDPAGDPNDFLQHKIPTPFDLGFPVIILGTGLSEQNHVNHKEIYSKDCKPPCGYLVAVEYGHTDMMDDDLSGINGFMARMAFKSGKGPRKLMRECAGGVVVAFLRKCLEGESSDFGIILDDPGIAPAKLDPVEYVEA